MIDNASHSYGFQLDNGYPVLSWYDDPEDRELVYVSQFLNDLAPQPDVRPMLSRFLIRTFWEEKICCQVGGVVEYAVEEMEDDDIEKELAKLVLEKEQRDRKAK